MEKVFEEGRKGVEKCKSSKVRNFKREREKQRMKIREKKRMEKVFEERRKGVKKCKTSEVRYFKRERENRMKIRGKEGGKKRKTLKEDKRKLK